MAKSKRWSDDMKRSVIAMCGTYTLAQIAEHIGKTEAHTKDFIYRTGCSLKIINKKETSNVT